MRYAIISDVHGNLHGLKAVLEDAERSKADRYLLLGDYYQDYPYPNEVIETIRSIPGATVIKGNKEERLLHLSDEVLFKKQMAVARWNLSQLSAENREYLISLPETAEISEHDLTIRLMHSCDIFFRTPRIQPFYSSWFRDQKKKAPFSHEEYVACALESILKRQDVLSDIDALPMGIYLFGHNHLQFHASLNGRIFINPGSCGVPLDGDTAAAYTLLDIDGTSYRVIERRVAYNFNAAIAGLRSSSLSAEAPEWRKIVEKGLLDGLDYFDLFLTHVFETARCLEDTANPVGDQTWQTAYETWDFETMTKKDC